MEKRTLHGSIRVRQDPPRPFRVPVRPAARSRPVPATTRQTSLAPPQPAPVGPDVAGSALTGLSAGKALPSLAEKDNALRCAGANGKASVPERRGVPGTSSQSGIRRPNSEVAVARTPCGRSPWSAAGRERPTHGPLPSRRPVERHPGKGGGVLKSRVETIPGGVGCQGFTRRIWGINRRRDSALRFDVGWMAGLGTHALSCCGPSSQHRVMAWADGSQR
jgi:hypothetical protein